MYGIFYNVQYFESNVAFLNHFFTLPYVRDGQTTAHGPHAARHDFLCDPRKPQEKNFTLSLLSVVMIYKK